MHCHLDFDDDPRALADGLASCGTGAFSVTVEPEGYERAARLLALCSNVRVGAGLHPWWVEDGPAGEAAVERAVANVAASRFVGEVGLDFGPKYASTSEAQIAAFDRIAAACAAEGGKVLSLHAVRSAGAVLDILERRGTFDVCACILHWFSGSSDELLRAAKLGCYFSVGPHMLASKRGRAYAQAIPRNRLLLETDEPPAAGPPVPAQELARLLHDALGEIARLRREDPEPLADRIARTSRALLKL
ncbi:TatD family hydrolase [Arabiibacter massiliensis]|uniref:TatD family hydrolase n=1 Tax=Arabiibacter massiliensis TaxID=1870985 RepID=UPI0009BA5E5F|nr:TatD family hydrolase [Arabiibacter massiliensis]